MQSYVKNSKELDELKKRVGEPEKSKKLEKIMRHKRGRRKRQPLTYQQIVELIMNDLPRRKCKHGFVGEDSIPREINPDLYAKNPTNPRTNLEDGSDALEYRQYMARKNKGIKETKINNRDHPAIQFLPCACGAEPLISETLVLPVSYAAYCPKCKIITPYRNWIEDIRQIWNKHASYGINNAGVDLSKYEDTNTQIRRHMESKHRLTSLSANITKRNYLEYWYYIDEMYMKKYKTMLREGMVFKNYLSLSVYLNERYEGGPKDDRKTHLKFWRRFFDVGKYVGNGGGRIIIRKVYDDYLPFSSDPDEPNKTRSINTFVPAPFSEKVSEQFEKVFRKTRTANEEAKWKRRVEKEEKFKKSKQDPNAGSYEIDTEDDLDYADYYDLEAVNESDDFDENDNGTKVANEEIIDDFMDDEDDDEVKNFSDVLDDTKYFDIPDNFFL